jgi:hypothetical protein
MADRTNAERQRRYIAKLKAKAAQAPDDARAELRRRQAELRARVGELEYENAALRSQLANALLRIPKRPRTGRAGYMPLRVYTAVVKCLHPDSRDNMTVAQMAEACGLFTQWKKAQDGR